MHGYLSSGSAFLAQRRFFDREYQTFAPDFKGFGNNLGMDYPYSLSDYVSDLKEYAYKNGIKKPHAVAHSFGARVALKLAAEDEEFFDSLVLTGAAGLKAKKTLKKRVKAAEFFFLSKFIKKEKLKRFYSPDYLALNDVMKRSFVKIVNESLNSVLPNIKNRTLLIFGDKDTETPLYMAKRLHNGIKNSKLTVIKNAGHFVFIDKPATFNLEVREFLLE